MTIEIKVPILPESVADALLLEWSKQPGDPVYRDEILVEVETDKVVLEVPSPRDGTLTEIVEESGATVLADQVLARIEPATDTVGTAAIAETATVSASSDSAAQDTGVSENSPSDDKEEKLSPAVRRLLDETGLSPSQIDGSGRDGRLTKTDVLDYRASADEASDEVSVDEVSDEVPAEEPSDTVSAALPIEQVTPPVEAAPASAPGSSGGSSDASQSSTPTPAEAAAASAPARESADSLRRQVRVPMSRLRQTIAKRLLQSQQNAALLTTFNEVNMQPVMALRSKYRESFEKKHGARLGFMSFFVKASVAALQKFPLVNACIEGTDIIQHDYCDIGIAVSSPRGLVVPVLRNCELMSYAGVEQQIQEFGSRAKQGKITLDELTGGTFTITNGGVFGSLLSTPIVNPPQSAILGMHKIQQRPMAENDEVVIQPVMYLALSYDHRIVDGREAVQFLVTIKDMLEDPARLLLDC